jgi:hypothetical protein
VEGRVYEKNTNIYNVKDEKHVHGQFWLPSINPAGKKN